MRLAFCLILIFTNVFCFGQSAKKQNALLKTQLEREVFKQDSLRIIFNKENASMTERRIDAGYLAIDLVDLANSITTQQLSINNTVSNLKLLEVNVDSVNVLNRLQELEQFKTDVEKFRDLFEHNFRFTRTESISSLDGVKIKEQNKLLNKAIGVYQTDWSINYNSLTIIRRNNEQLDSLKNEIRAMIYRFKAIRTELIALEQLYDNKLHTLKQEYFAKGPKGFSKNYEIVFPGAFNKNQNNSVFEEIGKDVERPIDYDEDAIPPVQEEKVIKNEEPYIYDIVEEAAEFVGGYKSLQDYFKKHLQVPNKVKKENISGYSYIRFVVMADGSLTNISLVRGLLNCTECDNEALKLVEGMPKWEPGKMNGKAVDSWYNLPVKFTYKK